MTGAVMEPFIIGTAGHIDHGKTTLVKALTGIDTDRLPEEKKRGITIELGFAHFFLPSGKKCSVIDVPGHEKFVRQMCGGAFGFDLALLVISAEEGIRPQTKEHFDILLLLKIPQIVVAITHQNRVVSDWLEIVHEDVRSFLEKTPYADSPLISCDSLSGLGIPELVSHLDKALTAIPPYLVDEAPFFRLPIDRILTLKGVGSVLTGTVLSGSIRRGEEGWIYPGRKRVSIKELEQHGTEISVCGRRKRLALNVSGVPSDTLSRGDILISPSLPELTSSIEARMEWVSSFDPLKKITSPSEKGKHRPLHCQLQFGLATTKAEVAFPLRDEEGATRYARISLATPLPLLRGDRFILRGYQPLPHYGFTMGGGTVLERDASLHPPLRNREQWHLLMMLLDTGSLEEVSLFFIRKSELKGMTLEDLSFRLNRSLKTIREVTIKLAQQGKCLLASETLFIEADIVKAAKGRLIKILREFHKHSPLSPGLPLAQWRSSLKTEVEDKVWYFLLSQLSEMTREVVIEQSLARHHSFSPTASAEEKRLQQKILFLIEGRDNAPPTLSELTSAIGKSEAEIRSHLQYLCHEKLLIRVKDHLYYLPEKIYALQNKLPLAADDAKIITPQKFREVSGLSRKYLIPLLEYFDSQQITHRAGNIRRLK